MRRPEAIRKAVRTGIVALMLATPALAEDPKPAFPLPPPDPQTAILWRLVNAGLQEELDRQIDAIGLTDAVRSGQLAVTLADITHLDRPRVASRNGDHMIYAASLPKIAILLGAFERIAQGELVLDGENESLLTAMIRVSSNRAASEMMHRVGAPFIAQTLTSNRYRLYDPDRNGGLWVGKTYAEAGLWKRDPLHNLSHGATTMQIARFYYLLEAGRLVSPTYSAAMKAILSEPGINHKFVRGMRAIDPTAALYRKSGSWNHWHSDSAIVERRGRRYIAVALTENARGSEWLERLIGAFDTAVFATAPPGPGPLTLTAQLPR